MSISKDPKTGTWTVRIRYKNWNGEEKIRKKRGFATKREAKEFEADFMTTRSSSMDMSFESFLEIYREARMSRLKESTQYAKERIIAVHILPFFKSKAMRDITSTDVLTWQNQLMKYRDANGNGYTPSYLKTIHNQLSCILNFAVSHFHLQENAARLAGNMGSDKNCRFNVWSEEEYRKFSKAVMKWPVAYYAFEVLYWSGCRLGELLALKIDDLDLEKRVLHIRQTYYRRGGVDHFTEPKTDESKRVVPLPQFLVDELQEYLDMLYSPNPNERVFPVSKGYLEHKMCDGCRDAGLSRIRIHDLRHSHVSLLIREGFNAVEIGNRVGHKSREVTFRYAHLFAMNQRSIADRLDHMNAQEGGNRLD